MKCYSEIMEGTEIQPLDLVILSDFNKNLTGALIGCDTRLE